MKRVTLFAKSAVVLACILFGSSGSYAQSIITVVEYSGAQQSYTIQPDGKIYFSNGNLMIEQSGTATPTSTSLALVRKIVFGGTPTSVSTIAKKEDYSLYPNPATTSFAIKTDTKEKVAVNVFASDGKQVISGIYNDGDNIDISRLTTGIYIVRINNKNFKLIKQ